MTPTAPPLPVDKSRCALEPIHIPGSVQPHGVLFVLDSNYAIAVVSENIEALLGISVAAVLGAPLARVFGAVQGSRLEQAIRSGEPLALLNPMRFLLEVRGQTIDFECVAHRVDAATVVELEPYVKPLNSNGIDLFAYVRTPIARMEAARDIASLTAGAADDLRAISGFDRVMIYRFDEEWNGDVLAESTNAAVPVKYLGLRFPAGDIPAQARRLYLRNALRLVADVDYVPALLVPDRDPVSGGPVDLSGAILRSVSPIHLEYLRNIDVRATLTISIIIGGKLWGLIACHHLAPRRVDCVTRASCEFLGQMLAWQLGSRQLSDDLQGQLEANALLNTYERHLTNESLLADGLLADVGSLMELFSAGGVVVRIGGQFQRYGDTPADDALLVAIAAGLASLVEGGVAASHAVETVVADGGPVVPSGASGALLIMLAGNDEYVLCLRPEIVESVNWAGDPRDSVIERDGMLHPRRSFTLWQESVRGRSARWSVHDIANAHRLRERILEQSQAIERRQAEEKIRHVAHHDALTGLPNRASFHETLCELLGHAAQRGEILALFFIDLDHFKVFNDEFGHATGDRILQAAAARMRHSVRRGDVVARLGGDEFVIIAPNLGRCADADTIARKVLATMAEPFEISESREIRFTASVGIAVYPRDAGDAEALVQHADLAMYRAKEQGRNSFQHFDAAHSARTYEQLSMQRRIDDGLRNDEFLPYYQPIVDLGSGKIIGLEALARWHDPERGVVPPMTFIGIAEESRLIVVLGGVMLRAACAQAVVWRQRPGCEDLYVSVNVSARQFREHDFLDTVLEALLHTGLAPAGLQLELTESIVIGDEHYAIETLRALSDAGISIAIDDFGTGYSSLSYLTRLPVDVIKIDQSFVRDLNARSDGNAIVRAVIAMAHSLKLAVVAEGVETAEQLAFLREEGCDGIQGYLIGKPVECAEATRLLEAFEPLAAARDARASIAS